MVCSVNNDGSRFRCDRTCVNHDRLTAKRCRCVPLGGADSTVWVWELAKQVAREASYLFSQEADPYIWTREVGRVLDRRRVRTLPSLSRAREHGCSEFWAGQSQQEMNDLWAQARDVSSARETAAAHVRGRNEKERNDRFVLAGKTDTGSCVETHPRRARGKHQADDGEEQQQPAPNNVRARIALCVLGFYVSLLAL